MRPTTSTCTLAGPAVDVHGIQGGSRSSRRRCSGVCGGQRLDQARARPGRRADRRYLRAAARGALPGVPSSRSSGARPSRRVSSLPTRPPSASRRTPSSASSAAAPCCSARAVRSRWFRLGRSRHSDGLYRLRPTGREHALAERAPARSHVPLEVEAARRRLSRLRACADRGGRAGGQHSARSSWRRPEARAARIRQAARDAAGCLAIRCGRRPGRLYRDPARPERARSVREHDAARRGRPRGEPKRGHRSTSTSVILDRLHSEGARRSGSPATSSRACGRCWGSATRPSAIWSEPRTTLAAPAVVPQRSAFDALRTDGPLPGTPATGSAFRARRSGERLLALAAAP